MSCHTPMLASLREHGVRLTAQRALILEDLYHHPGHCTVEEIFSRVGQSLPGLNRATIYRTLEMLREAKVITSCARARDMTEFEVVGKDSEQHHHLHCRVCGAELRLEPEPVAALKTEIARRHGFIAELDHLSISGLCAGCAQAQIEGPR